MSDLNARLTPDIVMAIKSDQRILKDIARDYGISAAHVSRLKSGRRWPHLTEED